MGLKSSGGGGGADPEDNGSGDAGSANADDDGDVVGADWVGVGDGGGVGAPCDGFHEVAFRFGCGGFEFGWVDLVVLTADGAFGGMAAGEGFASLESGFDVDELLTGFCFMVIGPCGEDLLPLLGGRVLDDASFKGPFCLFLAFA